MIQNITAQEREKDQGFGMCNCLVANNLFDSSMIAQVHVFTDITLDVNSQENKVLSVYLNPVQSTL